MPPLGTRTKGGYPPLLEGTRRPRGHQRAGIASTHRPRAFKTTPGSEFSLELVDLATPSPGRDQAEASSKEKENALFTTVVLGPVDIRSIEGDSPWTPNQIQDWKTEVSLGSRCLERCTMGTDCTAATGQDWRPRSFGRRQPALSRSGALDCPDKRAVARLARGFRELGFDLQAVPPLGAEGRLRKGFQ